MDGPQSTGSGDADNLLPAGSTTFDLPMGRVRVRIVDLPTAWTPFVAENYVPFAEAPGDAEPDLTISCATGSGTLIPVPGPGEVPVIDLTPDGDDRFRIRSHWQDGSIDLKTGKGELCLTDRRTMQFRMSLENFLRVACQLLLPGHGGFLLHSAGVLDAGRCFLFFGHSGAGKSTSTALSAPRQALSDDMVLIDLAGEKPMAHAVPFFGAYSLSQRVRGAYEIAGAFRLRQDESDRLVPLSAARAAATLTASVPFVHDLGVPHAGLTDLVTDLCGRIPVYDLHFTRTDRFWQLIEAELGPGNGSAGA